MTENLAALVLSDARRAAFDATLDSMQTALTMLTLVEGDERGRLGWLGPVSAAFCGQVAQALDLSPEVLPDDIDADDVRDCLRADVTAMEWLDRSQQRLSLLVGQFEQVRMAVGSDAMEIAMDVYGALVAAGKGKSVVALAERPRRRRQRHPL